MNIIWEKFSRTPTQPRTTLVEGLGAGLESAAFSSGAQAKLLLRISFVVASPRRRRRRFVCRSRSANSGATLAIIQTVGVIFATRVVCANLKCKMKKFSRLNSIILLTTTFTYSTCCRVWPDSHQCKCIVSSRCCSAFCADTRCPHCISCQLDQLEIKKGHFHFINISETKVKTWYIYEIKSPTTIAMLVDHIAFPAHAHWHIPKHICCGIAFHVSSTRFVAHHLDALIADSTSTPRRSCGSCRGFGRSRGVRLIDD